LRVRFAITPIPEDEANTVLASRPESHQAALEVARRSIVMLKNDGGVLPISKNVKKIAVVGQNDRKVFAGDQIEPVENAFAVPVGNRRVIREHPGAAVVSDVPPDR
ncbi:MAG: glycoside hydrolase family 3 C-terminal domain-containing protein, partial [Clostridia bacterium]|nr:glycoside hydrolase family 3 C-terminal domain-containing protein [Clostridia bacterium]